MVKQYTVISTFAGCGGSSFNELKRLSTFPDDFKFIGSFTQQWARIGNAVMPKFMFKIANNLKINILDKL